MPHALELPRMRSTVIPLVCAGNALVRELVSYRLPRLPSVIGPLDQLPKPAGGLRRIQPVRIRGRSFHVVNLPAREVGAAHAPALALAVSSQDERALARAHQNSHTAHLFLPSELGGIYLLRWMRIAFDSGLILNFANCAGY